ncbi:helix-turn-helix transcriptional regulator [Streptosporangium lutulentum]|uniref:DNA-binding transcriptional regulator YafY n=1 Tax=Streptosporangium lutulentum TaxID=1461250 RepID=A0ABT9Q2I5_9ACTN|nr:WYL domain-containing protein [Streptosporangium lutulentum]MDP9840943.1 putative DNA-binding transcriptional regulator YafY [Streptosporangium lutulentum]
MNRTDRFHALIEELRAIAPRCRSARELATGLEVSVRTVERDLRALQQSGVPVRADPGGRGYALGESVTPLPIAFTPDEAVAVAAALSGAQDTPFAFQARSALNKLVAAMSPSEGASGTVPGGDGAGEPLTRGHTTVEPEPYPRVSRVIEQALLHRRVLRLRYEDRKGRTTVREVEPATFVGGRGGRWYLVGVCRLRQDARAFRLDRIGWAEETGEVAPEHPPERFSPLGASEE